MRNELRHQILSKQDLRHAKSPREEFRVTPRLPIRVVLDRVHQPYNIGAIFRLCDAMLVESLVIVGCTVDLRKRRLVQAAKGTQHWVPWHQESSVLDAVKQARDDGYQIAIAELAANSVPMEMFVPKFPVCIVFGSEAEGVAQEVADIADAVIQIPMRGMANSINVATAAAIVLYGLAQRATTAPATSFDRG